MSIPRPPVLLDFVNGGGFLDNRLVFTRAAGTNGRATFIDNRGFMVDAVNNTPRFDHTITGQPLGLLMEFGTAGNYVTNPRNEGSAGTALSIGNMPSNQTVDGVANGVTVERLADRSIRGMNFAVYRFAGTATATTAVHLRTAATDPAASSGQTWNYSAYVALDTGSTLTGVSQAFIQCVSVGGAATTSTNILTSLVPGQEIFRSDASVTLDSGTTAVRGRIRFQISSGASPNFTILVGPTQLEARGFPTSQILNVPGTTNQNCFRSIESLSGVLADFGIVDFGREGSVICDYRTGFANSGSSQSPLELSDLSVNNFFRFNRITAGNINFNVTAGGTTHAVVYAGGVLPDYTRHVSAVAWRVNDVVHCLNGALGESDTVAPTMPTVTHFYVGSAYNGGNIWTGHIRKVMFYPDRLSNTILQQLSA